MATPGQPPKYRKVSEISEKIAEYFEYIAGEFSYDEAKKKIYTREPEPATITGLALYLGFESRQSIYDYEKNGRFSYTVKRARLRIEQEYEKKLHGANPTGPIFALKNFGWRDQQQMEHTGKDGADLIPKDKQVIIINGKEITFE